VRRFCVGRKPVPREQHYCIFEPREKTFSLQRVKG
jgi:hypothetical protein